MSAVATSSTPVIAEVVRDFCAEFGYQLTPFQMDPTTIAYSGVHSEAVAWKAQKEKDEKKKVKKSAKAAKAAVDKFETYASHPFVLMMKELDDIMREHFVAVDAMKPEGMESVFALFHSKMHKLTSNPGGRVSNKFKKFKSKRIHLLVGKNGGYVMVACVGKRRVVVLSNGKFEVFTTVVANAFLFSAEVPKFSDFIGQSLPNFAFTRHAFIADKSTKVKDEE